MARAREPRRRSARHRAAPRRPGARARRPGRGTRAARDLRARARRARARDRARAGADPLRRRPPASRAGPGAGRRRAGREPRRGARPRRAGAPGAATAPAGPLAGAPARGVRDGGSRWRPGCARERRGRGRDDGRDRGGPRAGSGARRLAARPAGDGPGPFAIRPAGGGGARDAVICVLQFDAASVAVLERLGGEGRLPNLTAIAERGRRVELATPATDFAAGAFYTLYSGVELADHGIFYPFQWSAPEQRARYATAFDAPPAVWERLGRAGLRTLAIDPYESRPPAEANGVFVCGWGFADRVVLPRWSRPEGLGRRLERRHGRGPGATEIFGRPRPGALLRLRERLIAAPARIAALAEELLGRESFDLAWLTFSAAHLAGHQFWDLSQVDRERLDREARATLAGALDDVYVAVDEALGRVLAALPPGSDVLVTSAVGMDVNTSRADLLSQMLAAVLSGGPLESNGGGAIWRLRAAMPASLRAVVAGAIPDRAALELTARLELRGHDWARTRAFAHPADNQGYVRLNLRGREREGTVPAQDADEQLAEIAAGLATFHDPDGAPAVASVERTAEHYAGRHADRLPDLVVRWSRRPATRLAAVRSERFGLVRRHGSGSGRSGNHTPGDAWAILTPGSSRHTEPSRPPRLVDVAATVCAVTGADPGDLPGEPLLAR
ncbi:MAG: hypothetical protein GEU88_19390 [Solirubrobacterales bacterium]|nr:hypothetical protein [Solirubrobacterales bacterium]